MIMKHLGCGWGGICKLWKSEASFAEKKFKKSIDNGFMVAYNRKC